MGVPQTWDDMRSNRYDFQASCVPLLSVICLACCTEKYAALLSETEEEKSELTVGYGE